MKRLEEHLPLICQMMEDEEFNFRAFLEKIREKSEGLKRFPCGLPPAGEGAFREEEKRG